MKTLNNTSKETASKNVKDIQFWGEKNQWKLINKAWSKKEKWMKSTKAMEIEGYGCLVQISTQQDDNVAESITFIPGITIQEEYKDNEVISRRLVHVSLLKD